MDASGPLHPLSVKSARLGVAQTPDPLAALAVFLLLLAAAGCSQNSGTQSELDPTALTLDKSQREYLWQIEHHGLVLGKFGFQAIKDGLIKNDARVLGELLSPDFAGEVYQQPHEIRTADEVSEIVRMQESSGVRSKLAGQAFVEHLLEYRRIFKAPPRVQVSLMRLSPTEYGNLTSNSWRASFQLRLWGESEPGQPAEVVLLIDSNVCQPTEKTLAQKHWLQSAALTQSLVGKSRRFLFRDVAQERGLTPDRFHDNWKSKQHGNLLNTGGVYVCDYDRDGILDVLVTDVTAYVLYKGLTGGQFRDVTRAMRLPVQPLSTNLVGLLAAFVDLDGDGWEDLILGNDIFRNVDGKRFEVFTYSSNLTLPPDAVGLAIADYDRDGLPDLYVTRGGKPKASSWLEGKSGDTRGNQLWRNKGKWQFEDVTNSSGTAGGQRSTFSAVWLDANNDNWPDLYVINEFGDGALLVNKGNGTFREHLVCQPPGDFGSMGVTCGDIDNDGLIDLFAANMYSKAGSRVIANLRPGTYPDEIMAKFRQFVAGNQLHRNKGNLQFEQLSKEYQVAAVGWSYGAAMVDLNNDGWLDLYATCGFLSHSRSEPDG